MSVSSEERILDPAARVRTLSNAGSSVVVDSKIPALRYLRSGPQMEKMARSYYAEGQWEEAFILYNKFATLFVEKLPKHPGYAKLTAADKARVNKLLKPAFERALELKVKLKDKFEEEKAQHEKKLEAEAAARRAEEEKQQELKEMKERKKAEELAAFLSAGPDPTVVSSASSPQVNPPQKPDQPSSSSPISHPGAVASQEQTNQTNPHPPPAYESIANEASEPGQTEVGADEDDEEGWTVRDDMLLMDSVVADDEEEDYQSSQSGTSTDPNSRDVTATDTALAQVLPATYQHTRSHQEHSSSTADSTPPYTSQDIAPLSNTSSSSLHPPSYQPPGVTSNVALAYGTPQSSQYTASHAPQPVYGAPPSYPGSVVYGAPPPHHHHASMVYGPPSPQDSGYHYGYQAPPPAHTVAALSPSSSETPFSARAPSSQPITSSPPEVDRSKKPATSALTSLGGMSDGMRTLFIPCDIASQFLNLASPNTRKDTETCGILAGKFAQNKLRVTHIVVPKQKGKSDSCETLNEEEIFDVQDKYDLITLGWIHTHPSQTSFMSSVDLHTHCSYQLMLEEAIAIVCAPRYNQTGIFTLTQPHGLNYISNCTQKGFHVHPKEPPLYEECKHVKFAEDATVKIVDLR